MLSKILLVQLHLVFFIFTNIVKYISVKKQDKKAKDETSN